MKKGLFFLMCALGVFGFSLTKKEIHSFSTKSSMELKRFEKGIGNWLKDFENGCKKCGKPKK